MAPRGAQKTQASTDGAKPGAEIPPTGAEKHAFDADSRAKTREAAPVTIGEQTFHRRRKNWKVTKDLRSVLREQERAGIRADRARKQIDALDPDAPDQQLFRLEDEVDKATEESDEAAYRMIALLLRDDAGESPDVEHLKESLDSEDAGDLAASLAGGGAEDPTPETPSS